MCPFSFLHSTHCYLVCPRQLYILRIPTAAERVQWLVKQRQFPLCMHLCQRKYKREQVFMEVAGMHANYLWSIGRHEEAVRIWGEVHLPSAPALYWKTFVERLDEAEKIDLVVKWLPFNDRTKVGPEVYERLLLASIERGDFLTVLARVSRWPVLYNFEPILNKIMSLLEKAFVNAKADVAGGEEEQRALLLLVSVFKLFEFGDRFVEAAQILVHITRFSRSSDALMASIESWCGDDES